MFVNQNRKCEGTKRTAEHGHFFFERKAKNSEKKIAWTCHSLNFKEQQASSPVSYTRVNRKGGFLPNPSHAPDRSSKSEPRFSCLIEIAGGTLGSGIHWTVAKNFQTKAFPPRKRKKAVNALKWKWILLIWSTKWSLFIKLFTWLGCKSRDESNEPT